MGLLEAPEKSMEEILWTGFLFLKVSKCHYTAKETRRVEDESVKFCWYPFLILNMNPEISKEMASSVPLKIVV